MSYVPFPVSPGPVPKCPWDVCNFLSCQGARTEVSGHGEEGARLGLKPLPMGWPAGPGVSALPQPEPLCERGLSQPAAPPPCGETPHSQWQAGLGGWEGCGSWRAKGPSCRPGAGSLALLQAPGSWQGGGHARSASSSSSVLHTGPGRREVGGLPPLSRNG